MSSPFGKATRRLLVDRPQVEAPRGVQPSGTNRPSSSYFSNWSGTPVATGDRLLELASAVRPPGHGKELPRARENAPWWPAAMAGEAHPVPSRTRKLSPLAPMVLRRKSVGEQGAAVHQGAFACLALSEPGRPPRGSSARGPLLVSRRRFLWRPRRADLFLRLPVNSKYVKDYFPTR